MGNSVQKVKLSMSLNSYYTEYCRKTKVILVQQICNKIQVNCAHFGKGAKLGTGR